LLKNPQIAALERPAQHLEITVAILAVDHDHGLLPSADSFLQLHLFSCD